MSKTKCELGPLYFQGGEEGNYERGGVRRIVVVGGQKEKAAMVANWTKCGKKANTCPDTETWKSYAVLWCLS